MNFIEVRFIGLIASVIFLSSNMLVIKTWCAFNRDDRNDEQLVKHFADSVEKALQSGHKQDFIWITRRAY